jgi:single-strand DNA-binding protein
MAIKNMEAKSKNRKALNDVNLVGRISSITGEKKLPSGDRVFEFRVVIDRKSKGIDTIDIAAWSAALRKKIQSLMVEDWVKISGSIRRHFWQSSSGVASRWQVEALKIAKI